MTPQEFFKAGKAERIKFRNFLGQLTPEELQARETNLMVRLTNGHPTSREDVLLLEWLLEDARNDLETAREEHAEEIDQLNREHACDQMDREEQE